MDYTLLVDIKKNTSATAKKTHFCKTRKKLKIIPREAAAYVAMARETEKKTLFYPPLCNPPFLNRQFDTISLDLLKKKWRKSKMRKNLDLSSYIS